MDRFVNKKIEKQTIYEIYRACRLCGAGGGYKMPIIQNVINSECDVELRQKIRECVQIEVHQEDRMPPLICELCVDKVNDFYEFLEMCRQTNKRTRLRLGLPPQMMPRGAPDAGDCILGVTEQIYVNDEDSNEPLSDKKSKATKSTKFKKEPEKEKKEVRIKIESMPPGRNCRSVRLRQPSPPRLRGDRRDRDSDSVSLSRLQQSSRGRASPPPKSILKKGSTRDKKDEGPPLSSRLKRSREKDTQPDLPAKRVKIAAASPPTPAKRKAVVKPAHPCPICNQKFKTPQAVASHSRQHSVTFTDPEQACNACGVWFSSVEDAAAHHKRHRARSQPYRCRHCGASYKTLHAYEDHAENKCMPWEEAPDVECDRCWKAFPTQNLLDSHKCPGVSGRRGGKCSKCGISYMTRKWLLKHERYCKKGTLTVDPEIMARLRPVQVRVAKCDPLLANVRQEHYDVSTVTADFGLDKSCIYPYNCTGVRIKSEPSDCMVQINDLDFASYVHWDSEDSGESDADAVDLDLFTRPRKVDTLTACALKVIYSKQFLGKVPRKIRRLKIEKILDSALNDSLSELSLCAKDSEVDLTSAANDINDTVKSNSDKDDDLFPSDKSDGKPKSDDRDDDDLFPKENIDGKVTNDDFDSLFNSSDVNVELTDKVDDVSGENVSNSDETNDKMEVNEFNDSLDNNHDQSSVSSDVLERGIVENHSAESNDDKLQENEANVKTNNVESENSLNTDISEMEIKVDNESKEVLNSVEDESQEAEHDENKQSEELNANDSSEVKHTDDASESEAHIENTSEEPKHIDIDTDSKNEEDLSKQEENSTTDDTKMDTDNSISESTEAVNSTETKTDDKVPKISVELKTAKEVAPEIANDLMNGTDIGEENLNMDDLEDFSDNEFDDYKLMADLDEQIGEDKHETQITNDREDKKSNTTDVNDDKTVTNDKNADKKESLPNEIESRDENESLTNERESRDENESLTNERESRDENESLPNERESRDENESLPNERESIDEKESLVMEDRKVESEMDVGADKVILDELVPEVKARPMDLDSISDDEFNFDE